MIRRVTFAVKGSGSGGAGWIGKVEQRDSTRKNPITGERIGILGVYFGHPQEYTTDDPHMINALEKSGVATILIDEEIDEAEKEEEVAAAKQKNDEHGQIQDLSAMKLMDLKLVAKGEGLTLEHGMKKADVIALIEGSRNQEE